MVNENKLTSREAITEFCLSLGEDVYEDYPFDDNWAAMRHRANRKSFAFLYEYRGRLQLNIKCAPEWTAFWRGSFEGVTAGYHMNKQHWNTIILDGTVPDCDIKTMIDDSFKLTEPKKKKKA